MVDYLPPILDACCGSRMFWFDKENVDVLFMDKRNFTETLCDNRKLEVNPDVVADFRDMPFDDETFYLVVFDPPHLLRIRDRQRTNRIKGTRGNARDGGLHKTILIGGNQ